MNRQRILCALFLSLPLSVSGSAAANEKLRWLTEHSVAVKDATAADAEEVSRIHLRVFRSPGPVFDLQAGAG
ncbi:MAG TPA: hypothetical protein VH988_10200 [Thermoanaerobaculia bacterium]|jgi:hypothetical protein|nr:hypothetical protein [Thermoanaerobaculia bacterium]